MMNRLSLNCLLLFIALASGQVHAAEHVTYYVNDALGSPIMAMDEQGAVVWQESYQPYGQRQVKPAAANYDEQFYTGKQEEPDIGLQYFGARWYDPEAGRFTSIDPVGVQEGEIHSFNRYAYANNNPYKFVDPDGKDAVIHYHRNGNIMVNIPISFHGEAATPDNIQSIKNDIVSTWSGNYLINDRQVSVNVIVTEPTDGGVSNSIELLNGPTSYKEMNGASFVRRDVGEWNMKSFGMKFSSFGEAAHEAGHLMGASDHYKSKFNSAGERVSTQAESGWGTNLMSNVPGVPDGRNIEEILNSPNNTIVKE